MVDRIANLEKLIGIGNAKDEQINELDPFQYDKHEFKKKMESG